jgi:hypothetical protein
VSDFSERPMGVEAFDYIRHRLEIGKTFAHALLGTLALEAGSVFAYIPDDVGDALALDFTEGVLPDPPEHTWSYPAGGGVWKPTPNTRPWLAARVQQFVQNPGCIVIFEEYSTSPTSPFWEKHPADRDAATFVGDEVYFVSRRADSAADIDRYAIGWSGGAWPGLLGAFLTLEPNHPLLTPHDIDPNWWPELARRTVELAIGAYDGESFLIWTPSA